MLWSGWVRSVSIFRFMSTGCRNWILKVPIIHHQKWLPQSELKVFLFESLTKSIIRLSGNHFFVNFYGNPRSKVARGAVFRTPTLRYPARCHGYVPLPPLCWTSKFRKKSWNYQKHTKFQSELRQFQLRDGLKVFNFYFCCKWHSLANNDEMRQSQKILTWIVLGRVSHL